MKIVQLSTYPTILPRHGGQVRVSQIAHFLRLKGHQVRSFSLCEPTHKQYSADDLVIVKKDFSRLVYPPCLHDYATSFLALKEPYHERLKARVLDFNPEMVLVEQPWLYPFYKMLYGHQSQRPILVYSSQNIEWQIKQDVLRTLGLPDHHFVAEIKELEKELCEAADWVIACTDHDEKAFQDMGAKKTMVCANGVEKVRSKSQVNQLLLQLLHGRSYALFVGSAHAPNAIGFWEMLSTDLSYLKPDQIIVVAGSVSYILRQYASSYKHLSDLIMEEKIKLLGEVSDDVLASLLEHAQVILLPITMGGGSNLKTAEAIVSNRPTVATKTAIRGFEFASSLSQFMVVDHQQDFITALKQAFLLKTITLDKKELESRSRLYWGLTLEPLQTLLSAYAPSDQTTPSIKE